jgi:hypothetical protein
VCGLQSATKQPESNLKAADRLNAGMRGGLVSLTAYLPVFQLTRRIPITLNKLAVSPLTLALIVSSCLGSATTLMLRFSTPWLVPNALTAAGEETDVTC